MNDDIARVRQRRTGHDHGAGAYGCVTLLREIGAVSLTQFDGVVGNAKPIRDHLRKRCLVSLAVRLRGDDQQKAPVVG